MTKDDPAKIARRDSRTERSEELKRIAHIPDDQLTEEQARLKYPFRITVAGAPLSEQSRMFYPQTVQLALIRFSGRVD